MIKTAENSIIIATTAEGLIRKADYFRRSLYRAKESGVNILIAAPVTKDSKAAAKKLAEYAEIKNTESVIGRFVIVDNKQVTFMLLNDEGVHSNYDSGVWVNTPFFANALTNMFNLTWDKLPKLRKID